MAQFQCAKSILDLLRGLRGTPAISWAVRCILPIPTYYLVTRLHGTYYPVRHVYTVFTGEIVVEVKVVLFAQRPKISLLLLFE